MMGGDRQGTCILQIGRDERDRRPRPRLVYPCIIFVYRDSGDCWIDEETTEIDVSISVRTALNAEAQLERFAQTGKRGVTLRLGLLYGPTSIHTQVSAEAVRQGFYFTPGPDDDTSHPSGSMTPLKRSSPRWNGRRQASTTWLTTSR